MHGWITIKRTTLAQVTAGCFTCERRNNLGVWTNRDTNRGERHGLMCKWLYFDALCVAQQYTEFLPYCPLSLSTIYSISFQKKRWCTIFFSILEVQLQLYWSSVSHLKRFDHSSLADITYLLFFTSPTVSVVCQFTDRCTCSSHVPASHPAFIWQGKAAAVHLRWIWCMWEVGSSLLFKKDTKETSPHSV